LKEGRGKQKSKALIPEKCRNEPSVEKEKKYTRSLPSGKQGGKTIHKIHSEKTRHAHRRTLRYKEKGTRNEYISKPEETSEKPEATKEKGSNQPCDAKP